jgi:hypothetical protein
LVSLSTALLSELMALPKVVGGAGVERTAASDDRDMGHGKQTMKTAAIFAAALLLAGSASCAVAKTECSVEALNALHVSSVQVTQATATKSDSSAPHSLPLCPYPQQARYSGNGALTDAANWACVIPK